MQVAIERELTAQEVKTVLENAIARKGGLCIQVGRIGEVNISPRQFRITNPVRVSVHVTGQLITFSVEEEMTDKYSKFCPGNTTLNGKFMEWLRHAHECMQTKMNYGHPSQICFNQARQ